MQVHVKLHASLRKYLPAGALDDTVVLDLPPGARVGDVVAALGIPTNHAKIALVNGQQSDFDAVLQGGEQVSLFPPLAGG